MAACVSRARRKYGVKLPALHAAEGAPNANEFNCIQRGAPLTNFIRPTG